MDANRLQHQCVPDVCRLQSCTLHLSSRFTCATSVVHHQVSDSVSSLQLSCLVINCLLVRLELKTKVTWPAQEQGLTAQDNETKQSKEATCAAHTDTTTLQAQWEPPVHKCYAQCSPLLEALYHYTTAARTLGHAQVSQGCTSGLPPNQELAAAAAAAATCLEGWGAVLTLQSDHI